jgi:uncharacterized protein (DUF488 family)
MESVEFRDVLTRLIETARDTPTAVMCAESLWRRCHRRMLADALIARGCDVQHIGEGGRLQPHRLHPAARMVGQEVIYDRT